MTQGLANNIKWLKKIGKNDLSLVGGKAANLGELFKAGINIPDGFVVTSASYFSFLSQHKLVKPIQQLLQTIQLEDSKDLQTKAQKIQQMILAQDFSPELKQEIISAVKRLGNNQMLAVRSSATAEDLKNASFAGQQKTFLGILGENNLLKAIKECFASLYEPRAIYYRELHHFDQTRIGIAVIVQQMIPADISGVLFTVNPLNHKDKEVLIEAGLGLGEPIVAGLVNPDQYILDKKTGRLISQKIGTQAWQLKFQNGHSRHLGLSRQQQVKAKLYPDQLQILNQIGQKIEKHFQFPQDAEWLINQNVLYLVQSRPITAFDQTIPAQHRKAEHKKPIQGQIGHELLHGLPASLGVAAGPVSIIHGPEELDRIKPGDILVAEMTNPSYVPAMKRAKAIVTDTGGATSHAAIVSRELGIPAVVATGQATHILKNQQIITVDGTQGIIYQGKIDNSDLKHLHRSSSHPQLSTPPKTEIPITATKIYVNLAEPQLAKQVAKLPVDGVGLLRAEFMIAGLGEHPQSLVKKGRGKDYVEALEQGIRQIAASLSPRPVVFRTTDFKTNEYRGLAGGQDFEPKENNPMMGFRGASRYLLQPAMFKLELEALRNSREKYGLDNIYLMIPFVRTTAELISILELINQAGLKRTPHFKIWLNVEVPSTVILIDKFLELDIDGISIGSNDLTQLILGIDRDNSLLARQFDERDEAVQTAMRHVIRHSRLARKTSSICGNAPSVYPEVTEALVRAGITSISVTPDMVIPTRKLVASIEKRILLDQHLA